MAPRSEMCSTLKSHMLLLVRVVKRTHKKSLLNQFNFGQKRFYIIDQLLSQDN